MSLPRRKERQTLWQTFAVPIAIALLSVIGLVSALTGEGVRDAISWATLGIPVAAAGWAYRRRRRPPAR